MVQILQLKFQCLAVNFAFILLRYNFIMRIFLTSSLIASCLFAFDPLYTTSATVSLLDGCKQVNYNEQINLTDALNLALCSNPKTKSAYASIMKSAADLGVSKSAYLPTVNTNASQPVFVDPPNQNNMNGSGGLNLSLLLYDFGQTSNNVLNASKLLEAANYSGENVVQALFLKTIKDYCAVLATKESVDAAKISEDSALESYKAASAKYDAGVIAIADVLQAKTSWSQAVLARVSSEGDYELAKATLAYDIGISLEKKIKLVNLPVPDVSIAYNDKVKDLIEQAIAKRPDLKAASASVEAAKASLDAAKSLYYPTISLSGQLGYADKYLFPPPNSSLISVNITLPLFSGFNTYYKVRSAKEQLNIKKMDFDTALKDASLEVYDAYNRLKTQTRTLQTMQVLLESAEQSEKVARGRYDAGVGKIIDLLSAQSALQSARQQRIKAELDWRAAKASLAYSMGMLSVDLVKNEVGK